MLSVNRDEQRASAKKLNGWEQGRDRAPSFPLLHFSPSLFLSLVVTSLEPVTGYDLVLNLSCELSDEQVSLTSFFSMYTNKQDFVK